MESIEEEDNSKEYLTVWEFFLFKRFNTIWKLQIKIN